MKKYSKILIIIIYWIGFSTGLWAQQIVASSGNTFQNGEGSISFTLGEVATDTYSREEKILTQGFHQTTITITSIEGPVYEKYSITAFPNPTSDKVNLKIDSETINSLNYTLYDIGGSVLLSNKIESEQTEISFTELKTAVYILKIELAGEEIKTFKIVKE